MKEVDKVDRVDGVDKVEKESDVGSKRYKVRN
jgi:hypothetical protein